MTIDYILLKIKENQNNKKISKIDLDIEMRFGSPGSGKTTDLVRQAVKYSKYVKVFSNVPINYPNIYEFKVEDLGKYLIDNCIVLIDESSLNGLDNRDWKKFSNSKMSFFKLHRHFKTKIIIYSQAPNDCDKKIRDLQTYTYNIVRLPFGFSKITKYKKVIDISEDGTEFIQKIKKVFLSTRFFFRPLYYRFFDSYDYDVSMFEYHNFKTYVDDDYNDYKLINRFKNKLNKKINRIKSIINILKIKK